jgi:hypothetical protein
MNADAITENALRTTQTPAADARLARAVISDRAPSRSSVAGGAKSILNRTATPLTLGLFAISAVSGAALFFHVGQGVFHGMHEWLSMLLLVPFALHIWKNWGAMLGYVRRRALLRPLAATLLLAAAFAIPAMSGGERGSPRQAVQFMTQTRLADLAPVLKTTPNALQASLVQRGYKVTSLDETLAAVAAASGAPVMKVLLDVIPAH